MRDVETSDDRRDPGGSNGFANRGGELFRRGEYGGIVRFGNFEKVVDFDFRDDEHVSGTYRIDVEERERAFVLVYLVTRDFSGNDSGEEALF